MTRERTHWDGCWQERTHHDCALARIAALEAELAAERGIVDRIWAIFGRPDYKSLNGRSIYDLIAAERTRRGDAEAVLNASAARIATLDTALRDYTDALVAERKRREAAERILLNIRQGGWVGTFTPDFDAHFARYKD